MVSYGIIAGTAGCISSNSIDYDFKIISLYEDISKLDIPEEMDELPHVLKSKNDLIIEGSVAYGDCSEPYVSNISYNDGDIDVVISTRSTKNIIDKIVNPGCTLALNISGFRISIPIKNKNVDLVNIVINHSEKDVEKTIEL